MDRVSSRRPDFRTWCQIPSLFVTDNTEGSSGSVLVVLQPIAAPARSHILHKRKVLSPATDWHSPDWWRVHTYMAEGGGRYAGPSAARRPPGATGLTESSDCLSDRNTPHSQAGRPHRSKCKPRALTYCTATTGRGQTPALASFSTTSHSFSDGRLSPIIYIQEVLMGIIWLTRNA